MVLCVRQGFFVKAKVVPKPTLVPSMHLFDDLLPWIVVGIGLPNPPEVSCQSTASMGEKTSENRDKREPRRAGGNYKTCKRSAGGRVGNQRSV